MWKGEGVLCRFWIFFLRVERASKRRREIKVWKRIFFLLAGCFPPPIRRITSLTGWKRHSHTHSQPQMVCYVSIRSGKIKSRDRSGAPFVCIPLGFLDPCVLTERLLFHIISPAGKYCLFAFNYEEFMAVGEPPFRARIPHFIGKDSNPAWNPFVRLDGMIYFQP